MRHPLLRLLGGGALLGVGCILVLHFGWLDYLLRAVSGPEPRGLGDTLLDWFAIRMPYLVAALVGGLGGGYLAGRGGWLAGIVGALECFLLSFLHFTLAGANFTFLVRSPELLSAVPLAAAIAAAGGAVGQLLSRGRSHWGPGIPAPR